MRRSSDLTVDRPRRRFSGRGILIGIGGLFLFVLIFGRAIARFYVDFLWHDALGRNDVFWGVLQAKVTLFAAFFVTFAVIAGLNLFIADRAAPTHFPANVHPYVERFHEVFGQRLRIVRYAIAALFALLLALPGVALWQDWLLFRNAREFGVADSQFSADVGFYVFQLPFLSFVLNWLFAALIVVLLLTAAAHILNGGVVFVSPVPVVRQATKAHLAVLLAVLAVVKAGDYWLDRYDVTNSQTGIVQGATYSVVRAQLPAIMLLILIALLTAGLYLSVVRTGSFRLPLIASALWLVVALVGGVIYPAVVQALVVNPNQQEREAPYIERNVVATREALGLTDVDVRTIGFESLTAAEIEGDLAPLENVRLLNPAQMNTRFLVDRGEVAGLTIDDLDVDRYVLEDSRDGNPEEVLITARELQLSGVTNKSWQGLHLINTRGCGLVLAPSGRVLESQRPDYRTVELERPELYFSPILTGYAIANTSSAERECSEPHQYEGTLGVEMSSFTRRAAFALAFLDYNVLGFGGIRDDSQMLWVRGINDRLQKVAPFLSFDADPYPVAVDGRAVWVTDAYTTTSRYPYGQRIGDVQRSPNSGLDDNDNYVRNSVKAVVDAYTGDITFYVVDEQDPILRAWRGAFPDLFTPLSEMPEELIDNLRYPEDMFRIQTDVYSKYRIAPDQFFQRVGAWSVAQAPSTEPSQTAAPAPGAADATVTAAQSTFSDELNSNRFIPYYTMFNTSTPGEPAREDFVILRPFVPFSTNDQRTELQAFMTASSSPGSYGELTTYIVEEVGGRLPDGPLRVAGNAESTEEISRRISLDNVGDGGTEVRFGDLQLIPVADGLIYVRPYYVSVPQNSADVSAVTEYRAVIVSYADRSVLARTVSAGLADLFPGFESDVGEAIDEPTEPGSGEDGGDDPAEPTPDPDRAGDDPVALLEQADAVFLEADEALAVGDLGLYQEKIDEARQLIADAFALLEQL
ncbi:MAG TPA: UPF0182 family protein [Ilumatobacteraceae bacterium]|nr:UPF0182 family protein [Ilumatobacteraceae bacterium]